jgi:ABC-2 type transport system permease protein
MSSSLKDFRSPQSTITRFVAKRTYKGALLWGAIFGFYILSKSESYAKAYPTLQSRISLVSTLSNNVGLKALLGNPHNAQTIQGFVAWNGTLILTIIAAIWGLVTATKTFRGEEDAGRLELLLMGPLTAGRAALDNLLGLGASFLVMLVVSSIILIGVGRMHTIGIDALPMLFFALATTSAAAMFIALGALMSQIMPNRGRAVAFAAGIFGISFLIRAMADTTNNSWLLTVSPIGWIEKLQPLYGSRPVWFIPIFGLTLIVSIATVMIAGRRDLGDSLIADKETHKSHMKLLRTPFLAGIRLTRTSNTSWLVAILVVAYFYGLLTKSVENIKFPGALHHLAGGAAGDANANLYLGIVFFFVMLLIMFYAVNAVGILRKEEEDGYLDNLFVRPVGRLEWLGGRVFVVLAVIVVAGLVGGVSVWAGAASQHSGISFHELMFAGVNAIAPAILTSGVCVLILGFVPRITTTAGYVVIGWAFLLQMLATGVAINHWLMDTSVLSQIHLAPAVSPDWTVAIVMSIIGIVLGMLGALRFRGRDLQTE